MMKYLTLAQLEAYQKISERELRNYLALARRQAPPCCRPGWQVLVRRSAFDTWSARYHDRGKPVVAQVLRELGLDPGRQPGTRTPRALRGNAQRAPRRRPGASCWLLEAGADLRWVKDQLGPASIEETEGTYGHLERERHERRVDVDAVLGGVQPRPPASTLHDAEGRNWGSRTRFSERGRSHLRSPGPLGNPPPPEARGPSKGPGPAIPGTTYLFVSVPDRLGSSPFPPQQNGTRARPAYRDRVYTVYQSAQLKGRSHLSPVWLLKRTPRPHPIYVVDGGARNHQNASPMRLPCRFLRFRRPFPYERIQIPPASERRDADRELLIAEVRALEERVIRRRLWAAPVVRQLLLGAIRAGDQSVEKGRLALNEAQRIFDDDVQTKNRITYVGAMFGGAVVCGALMAGILWLAGSANGYFANLAERRTIVSLFTFAAVGSLTSVLSRISQIDLKEGVRPAWLVLSAGVRPLVAIAFASVVYVVLKEKMIKISIGDSSPEALYWVAAFLCGFSERFASDILDRLPFLPK